MDPASPVPLHGGCQGGTSPPAVVSRKPSRPSAGSFRAPTGAYNPAVGARIDLGKRTVMVSPGALLESAARRIGFDRGEARERQWIGQAVHRRVLSDALATTPGYEVERGIRVTFPVDDFSVTLEGRIDGRFTDEDGAVVVDEVKSLHFAQELPRLAGSPRMARFQIQLRWYLFAISETEGRLARGRLVLADIESGDTRLHDVLFEREKVLEDLAQRVRVLVDEAIGAQALAEAKAAEARHLQFPFRSWRPGQHAMADAVERAAVRGEHLLVEAPTGIGKTAAALYPLLKASLAHGKRLFLLTAKTTQQEIFSRTLEAIEGDSFRSVRLRAKERMCANDVVLCHEDHCPYAADYGAKLEASGLIGHLLESDRHLSPDRIFEAARSEVVCPFEVSLELAAKADIVLGDYNYAFDPVVAVSGIRDPERLADTILLVDEIHNLVDRARGYYSPALDEKALTKLIDRIGPSSAATAAEAIEAAATVRALVRASAGAIPEGSESALVPIETEDLDEVRLGLDSLLVRHLAELRAGGERVPDDPVLELYFSFARFHDVAGLAAPGGRLDPAFDLIAARGAAGGRLAFLCKDPSRLLAETLSNASAVVGMSATLSPPEFYRDLLGFDLDRTQFLKLPSPFPRENRLVLIEPRIDTKWSSRGAAAPLLAALVADVARACPGNVLVLFPSYRFLDDVRRLLPPLPGRRVVRPSDRSTEQERQGALAILKDGGAPVLLFAVSGGAFAEGVDYPGEMLSAVVVVSPALPQVRFEQERMRLYFEERFEKGFEYAYVIPGMTRVIQSAGRVIRSETDRGVIVLACRRFLQNPYRRFLPEEWFGDSPDELATTDVGGATRAFFSDG